MATVPADTSAPSGGAEVRVVDCHAHIAVAELFTGAAAPDRSVADLREVDGHPRMFSAGRELTSVVREFFDPARMLAEARADGIDHLVLSPWVQLLPVGLEAREARRRSEVQCEALARIVSSDDSRRISALGAVPIEHPVEAVAALREAIAGGLSGAELPAAAADFLGGEDLEAFWATAESLGALIFVHPATRGIPLPSLDAHYLWNTVGNPMETALAAARLVMGGVMERHPDLRVLLAHGGGVLSAVKGRIAHGQAAVRSGRGFLTEPAETSIRRFYFDTLTHDRVQLKRLVDDFGAAQVVLGSDRPFDMGDPSPVLSVTDLGLSRADEAAVLGANAARLLGLAL